MSYFDKVYTWVIGLVGSASAFVSGHTDDATKILLALMVMDIVTGVLKGIKQKRLKSAIMHLGIIKKAGIVIAIIFASLLDVLVNEGMPVFRTLMVWLSIGNEGLSIIENLTALGVGIPAQIRERLAQVVEEKAEFKHDKDEAQG
jgi:toxin secretion/phage lysis holin